MKTIRDMIKKKIVPTVLSLSLLAGIGCASTPKKQSKIKIIYDNGKCQPKISISCISLNQDGESNKQNYSDINESEVLELKGEDYNCYLGVHDRFEPDRFKIKNNEYTEIRVDNGEITINQYPSE